MSSRFAIPPEKVEFYRAHGWVTLEDFVSADEVARIRGIAEDMVSGKIDTRRNRADLGAHADRIDTAVENIIQIGWPCDLTSQLDENEFVQAARAASDALYGDAPGTWARDMEQYLIKMPRALTDTPLHQDQVRVKRAQRLVATSERAALYPEPEPPLPVVLCAAHGPARRELLARAPGRRRRDGVPLL